MRVNNLPQAVTLKIVELSILHFTNWRLFLATTTHNFPKSFYFKVNMYLMRLMNKLRELNVYFQSL